MFRHAPLAAAIVAVLSPVVHADDGAAYPVNATSNASATGLSTVIVNGQKVYQPTTSSVGGKTEQDLRDIPQTVNVVNKELMEAQGATSLADALRNVPGITIGGAEGGQIGNNINLRGFTARTDIYVDGFRDRGQYYRDVFDIEQVEVLQGPSSMLFGRGSTGGVINQNTKKPKLRDSEEFSAQVGTDGRVRSTLDVNSKLSDTSAVRVNVFGQDLQTTRDTMSNKDFGIAPTVAFGIGEPTQVNISALLQHNNDMPDYGVQSLNGKPITASRDTYYGLASDRTNQDIAMLNGVIKHTFNENFELRNQTQFNRYRTDAIETAPRALSTTNALNASGIILHSPPAFGSYDPNQLWVQLQSHDRDITDTSVDNQTDLISKFDTGFVKHEVITGFEIGHDTYRNQTYSRTGQGILPLGSGIVGYVPLEDPSSATPGTVTTTKGNLARSAAYTQGIYANDTVSLGEQWKVVAGLRHDKFDATLHNNITLPLKADQSTGFTSKRAGLIYQPTEDQSYYVSYGTSFNPLLDQLTLTNGTQNLPPTNTRSYEGGAKWDLMNDKLSVSTAYFDELQKNVYTVSNGEYTANGNWRIKGYTVSAVGYVTDQIQISTSYMHLNPRVVGTSDGTDNSIPGNTPKDSASVWLSYAITQEWEVGGGPNYVSKRYVADTGITATLPEGNVDRVSVPAYTRLDGTVAYHQPRYDIRLNFLNLTNKSYYDALIQSDGGRAVPGIRRTTLLTGTFRF